MRGIEFEVSSQEHGLIRKPTAKEQPRTRGCSPLPRNSFSILRLSDLLDAILGNSLLRFEIYIQKL